MHEDGDIYTHKPEDIEKVLEGFLGFNSNNLLMNLLILHIRKLNEVQN